MLSRLLAANPEVSGLSDTGVIEDEGQFLQDRYSTDMVHGGAGRFGFSLDAHMTETSPLAKPETAEHLFESWAPYWQTGTRWQLEKTPANLIRSRFLQALFPDAHFIFITRHPIAVTLAVRKWAQTSIYPLIHHWLHCHQLLQQDLNFIRSYHLISYEELTAAPEQTIHSLCKYLDIEPHALSLEVEGGINAAYFEQWCEVYRVRQGNRDMTGEFDPKLTSQKSKKQRLVEAKDRRVYKLVEHWLSSGRYNVSLARRDAEDAVAMFEAGINTFGYSLLDLERRPSLVSCDERSVA